VAAVYLADHPPRRRYRFPASRLRPVPGAGRLSLPDLVDVARETRVEADLDRGVSGDGDPGEAGVTAYAVHESTA
jgi:hypothetical protein